MKRNCIYMIMMAMILAWTLTSCGNKTLEEWKSECDSVGDFHDGYALCEKNDKWFFIDEKYKKRSGEYDKAQEFSNGYAIVRSNHDGQSNIIFLNAACEEIHYPVFDTFGSVNSQGNVWVTINGRDERLMNVETGSFRLNLDGGESLQQVMSNGNAVVRRNPEYEKNQYNRSRAWLQFAIYNANGEILVPYGKYSYIGIFHNGMAQYSTTGFITPSDIRNGMEHINEVLCGTPDNKIRKYGRLGFIDENGNIAIPERYRSAMNFTSAGYAKVNPDSNPEQDKYETLIDRQGRELSGREKIIASATYLEDGKWISGKDEKGNYLSANNKGMVKTWETGVKAASVNDIIATKKGSVYSFYRTTEDDLEPLFTLNGTGQANEIVCYRNGNAIEIYSGYKARYCEKYDLTGHRFTTENTPVGPYDLIPYKHRLHSAYEYCAFIFE